MPLDAEILADQINRAFRGGSWHGPSVMEVLAGVSAHDAEIVLHMASGYALVLARVRGESAELQEDEAWPRVPDASPEAWGESQRALERLNQQLVGAVRSFSPEQLLQELGSEFTAYTQFCGAPQHDLYHAGQIVMLKKALSAQRGAAWQGS